MLLFNIRNCLYVFDVTHFRPLNRNQGIKMVGFLEEWKQRITSEIFWHLEAWPYTQLALKKIFSQKNLYTCLLDIDEAGIDGVMASQVLTASLRFGFCVLNYLLILSDFLSREKLAQKWLEPKDEQFARHQNFEL